MQITINARYLRSLRHLMARKDHREYLNGVAVQCDAGGKYYVACDGVRLGVYRETWDEDETPSEFAIVVPADTVNAMKLRKNNDAAVLCARSDGAWELNTDNGPTLVFVPIGGEFPNWRRCFPTMTTNEPGAYDWDFLADFNACAREGWIGRVPAKLHQNGPGAAAVVTTGCPDFIGLVMPRWDDELVPSAAQIPTWINGLVAKQASATDIGARFRGLDFEPEAAPSSSACLI